MKEVTHYQHLDSLQRICWIDILEDKTALQYLGLSKIEAMTQLHVLDRDGHIAKGIWAFATLWEVLPYYRYLAKILRVTHTLPLLQIIYKPFARWRYNRRCADGFCGMTDTVKRQ